MRPQAGFSLMELVVVMAIMAILMSIAIPVQVSKRAKDEVKENLELLDRLKPAVRLFHEMHGRLPNSLAEAGLPPANKLIGNYTSRIELQNGAFHIHFGQKAMGVLQDKVLTVRAIVVTGSPASPLSWLCGYSAMPQGMEAGMHDFSSVPAQYLPVQCRDTKAKAP